MRTLPFTKLSCLGADDGAWKATAATAPVPLAADLQRLIRGIPSPATGRQLVQFMNAALELSSRGGVRVSSGDTMRARQLLSDAVSSPALIGVTSMTDTYPRAGKAYAGAVDLATQAVGGASGDVASTHVKLQAIREVPRDLAVDTMKLVDRAGHHALVAAGLLGGAYFVARLLTGGKER